MDPISFAVYVGMFALVICVAIYVMAKYEQALYRISHSHDKTVDELREIAYRALH